MANDKKHKADEGGDEIQEKILGFVESIHSENVEMRSRVERLEKMLASGRGTAAAQAATDTRDIWERAGKPNPFADVDWESEEAVTAVAAQEWRVFLRDGSVMHRDGKRIDGPKPNFPMPDLESAFIHKAKFDEIEEIEWVVAQVKKARDRFAANAKRKGMRLPYHWGRLGLASERVYPKGVVAGA